MTIRLACASTFTALGLACSSTTFARVVVYMPVPVIYAPPRPLDYPVPVDPVYVTAPPPAAVAVALPVVASTPASPVKPMPMYTNVVVPAPTNYSVVPAPVVVYAQPLMAVPR